MQPAYNGSKPFRTELDSFYQSKQMQNDHISTLSQCTRRMGHGMGNGSSLYLRLLMARDDNPRSQRKPPFDLPCLLFGPTLLDPAFQGISANTFSSQGFDVSRAKEEQPFDFTPPSHPAPPLPPLFTAGAHRRVGMHDPGTATVATGGRGSCRCPKETLSD